jgi:hypothetical protein
MRAAVATLAMTLLVWTGCVHVDETKDARRGPPPLAPAHGYRHQHGAVDLRWDAHLGVYVVIGHPHHFFHDGRYYRRAGEHWERCGGWKKANWRRVEAAEVPAPLAEHYRKAERGKPGKGHGPAKPGQGPAKRRD